ncbi:MAG: hypothetical protein J6K05_04790 [Bacteroidaceae bacterium]|nr:hypothetical protein [Bacteroidaceae bacterium]
MKALTIRLGQFAICALVLTVLFRYALNLCIDANSTIGTTTSSIVYGGLMFLIGWYFGKKDANENEIHDIGFRFHLVTYILCIGIGYGVYHLGWNAESLRAMTITAISWGIGLTIHFIFYLIEQKRTIKGYAREDIFQ